MRDRGNFGTLAGPDRIDLDHERIGMRFLEVVADAFLEDRRGEGAKRLAALDALVENVAHLRAPRIGKNGTIAESARPPFAPSLIPADDLAAGERLRGLGSQSVGILDSPHR